MANLTMQQAFAYYSQKDQAWTKSEINSAISGLGTVLTLKSRVDNLDALNAIVDKSVGDVYTVGAADAVEFEEYYWNGTRWEYMGLTRVNLDGYITAEQLYKGSAGTGTFEIPADGTILKTVSTKIGKVDTAVDELTTFVGELPDDAEAESIVGYVDEKFTAVNSAKADKLETGSLDQIMADNGNGNLKGTGKTITDVKNEVIGTAGDTKDNNTVLGAKAYAKDYADGLADNYDESGAAAAVLGASTDSATAATVYGAIAKANAIDTRVQTLESDTITEAFIDGLFTFATSD